MSDTDTATSDIPGLEFLQFALSQLVEFPDELRIDAKKDELGILLTVQVAEADMGKLIGKGGQTIKALRILLRTIGSASSQRVNMKVLEPA